MSQNTVLIVALVIACIVVPITGAIISSSSRVQRKIRSGCFDFGAGTATGLCLSTTGFGIVSSLTSSVLPQWTFPVVCVVSVFLSIVGWIYAGIKLGRYQ